MLVSAIMPVYNRRKLTEQALQSFMAQDWSDKELIVIDDGEDELRDLFLGNPLVCYIHLAERQNVGVKRNIACEAARGEVIVHFDSDDWSAPQRILDQLPQLEHQQLTGYHNLLFFDQIYRRAYLFHANPNEYAFGTSFCYWRNWWRDHPFSAKMIGEDNEFMNRTRGGWPRRFATTSGYGMMVARVHKDQTSWKNTAHEQYTPIPLTDLPRGFCEIEPGLL